jgi:hypothetical protein
MNELKKTCARQHRDLKSAMPQVQLPMFPDGAQNINRDLAFTCRDRQVTCFNGQLPVFTHPADDLPGFRLFTTQLIVNGTATQDEVVRAFGVSVTTVKRYVKKCRQGGCQRVAGGRCR